MKPHETRRWPAQETTRNQAVVRAVKPHTKRPPRNLRHPETCWSACRVVGAPLPRGLSTLPRRWTRSEPNLEPRPYDSGTITPTNPAREAHAQGFVWHAERSLLENNSIANNGARGRSTLRRQLRIRQHRTRSASRRSVPLPKAR